MIANKSFDSGAELKYSGIAATHKISFTKKLRED
jgi:hypothetical protein